ncbi:MAG: hypothetical protein ABIC95_00875 [archaeon]
MIITVVFFFLLMWLLGFSVLSWAKESDDLFMRTIIRLGVGLGTMPLLAAVFHTLHIPIAWWAFLLVGVIGTGARIGKGMSKKGKKHKKKSSEKKDGVMQGKITITKKGIIQLLVVAVFITSLVMMATGAFSYPWLEDDDPWSHALGVRYIGMEQTVRIPIHIQEIDFFSYIFPYPPGYDSIMGILYQLHPDVSDILKLFNAIIISLGFLFFYALAFELGKNREKALVATIVLLAIPSYLSHFIWAHAMIPGLFLTAMYAMAKSTEDKKWIIPAAIVIGSIFLTQPTQPVKLSILFFLYYATLTIIKKRLVWQPLAAHAIGIALSLFWWAEHAGKFMSGIVNPAVASNVPASGGGNIFTSIFRFFDPTMGTATRAYGFKDFFGASAINQINMPVGWGLIVAAMMIAGIVAVFLAGKRLLQDKHAYKIVLLLWFLFTFLGVNSMTFHLPIGLMAFRFWMLLAIPVALLAAEGIWLIASLLKPVPIPRLIIIALLVVAIMVTSFVPKYELNTMEWFASGFGSKEAHHADSAFFESLPYNTKVYSLSLHFAQYLAGYDLMSCEWCEREILEYRKTALEKTPEELQTWLRSKGYAYLNVDYHYANEYGQEKVNTLIQSLLESQRFPVVHQSDGRVVFKVG